MGTQVGGLFVVNAKTGATVAVVNVNAVSVAMNPVTYKIYASDFNSTLYVIDGATNNIETTMNVNSIDNIAVNPFTNRIYSAIQNFIVGGVAVIDGTTNQVIAQPPAGSGLSFSVAVDPIKNDFYSAEQFGTAIVYNGRTNTQVKAIAISGHPSGLADDPFTHTLYVSNYQTNSVDVINASTYAVTSEVAVGLQPEHMTDDAANELLYVGCQGPPDANGYPTFFDFCDQDEVVFRLDWRTPGAGSVALAPVVFGRERFVAVGVVSIVGNLKGCWRWLVW